MKLFLFALLFFIAACKEPKDPAEPKKNIGEEHSKVQKTQKTQSDSDLLPAHMNPVEAYSKLCSKAGYTVSQEMVEIFNNFDSSIYSKRQYDYIAPLDGITLGMGHWPQAELKYFFGSLVKNLEAKKSFVNESIKAMQALPEKECRAHLAGMPCEAKNIEALLVKTLLHPTYLKKNYSRNCILNSKYRCASGPAIYYDLPWLKTIVARALRSKVVTKWQLGFFEQDIIAPARKKAIEAGLQKAADSTLIFSSFESSFKSYATKLMKVGKSNSYLEFGGKRYHWSKPDGIALPSDSQLQAWRVLIAFRWYQYIKGQRAKGAHEKGCKYRLRDRQWHFYCKFLKSPVERYWPEAKMGAESCEKLTDHVKRIGGCKSILARDQKPACFF